VSERGGKGWRASCAVAVAMLSHGCGGETASTMTSEAHASEASELRLEGRFGDPGTLWGVASYEVAREGGVLVKELEVEVENAPPGVRHAVTIDGRDVDEMITNLDGEGELELVDDGQSSFPEGFVEPRVGSIVRIGELMQLELGVLETLAHLQTQISGPASGKIAYKVERLGDVVTQRFRIKLAGGPPVTRHAVRVAGVAIGELSIDDDGEGKLEFSTKEGLVFPEGFPDLEAGAEVVIGDLFVGRLDDALATAKG